MRGPDLKKVEYQGTGQGALMSGNLAWIPVHLTPKSSSFDWHELQCTVCDSLFNKGGLFMSILRYTSHQV